MKKSLILAFALILLPLPFTASGVDAAPGSADEIIQKRPGRGQGNGQGYGQGYGQGRRGMRSPPPEAFEACSDLSEGSSCSFSNRRGEPVEGTCFTSPQGDGDLFCRSERRR